MTFRLCLFYPLWYKITLIPFGFFLHFFHIECRRRSCSLHSKDLSAQFILAVFKAKGALSKRLRSYSQTSRLVTERRQIAWRKHNGMFGFRFRLVIL